MTCPGSTTYCSLFTRPGPSTSLRYLKVRWIEKKSFLTSPWPWGMGDLGIIMIHKTGSMLQFQLRLRPTAWVTVKLRKHLTCKTLLRVPFNYAAVLSCVIVINYKLMSNIQAFCDYYSIVLIDSILNVFIRLNYLKCSNIYRKSTKYVNVN